MSGPADHVVGNDEGAPGDSHRYAYLHGFGSGPSSFKGTKLRALFADRGLDLDLSDLNLPSFAKLDCRAMFEALDARDEVVREASDEAGSAVPRWRFIGSSLGGWLAARWAMARPERVDRLLLLCPGFGLIDRWPQLLGAAAFERWRVEGAYPFLDGREGVETPVHFKFYRSCAAEPSTPEVFCPTVIVHGLRDEVVPFESSRRYAERRAHVDLIAVDDDHGLAGSVDAIMAAGDRLFL